MQAKYKVVLDTISTEIVKRSFTTHSTQPDTVPRMDNETRAKRIDLAIQESAYTQAEIARRLGITPQAVQGWRTTGEISRTKVVALARLLDRQVGFFLFDSQQAADAAALEVEAFMAELMAMDPADRAALIRSVRDLIKLRT